jgi:hypothetical protein
MEYEQELLEAAAIRLKRHDHAAEEVMRLRELLIEYYKEVRALQRRVEELERQMRRVGV